MNWNSDKALNVQILQLFKPTLGKAGFNVKRNATHLLAKNYAEDFPLIALDSSAYKFLLLLRLS